MTATRHTFVLVHGTSYGGWCYRRVADMLQALGHKVYTLTLTGVGERSHLMSANINLDTHIMDVVNVIKWEDLENIVLCGHSYGGWVISGAAEHIEDKIASIVFLDAFMPENGQKGLDTNSPHAREAVLEAVKNGQISRPPVPAAHYNVNEKDQAWADSKTTPQPIGISLQPINLTGARDRIAKKTYIRATGYAQPSFDAAYAKTKADPSWRTYEVPCGHDVMLDMPERLVEILLESA
jgi:pimeloyl-ACP methyl ester carboxylesterase